MLRIRKEKKEEFGILREIKNKMEGIQEVEKRIRKLYFTDISIYLNIYQLRVSYINLKPF